MATLNPRRRRRQLKKENNHKKNIQKYSLPSSKYLKLKNLSHRCSSRRLVALRASLTFSFDHRRSATAEPLGQVKDITLTASTYSPHLKIKIRKYQQLFPHCINLKRDYEDTKKKYRNSLFKETNGKGSHASFTADYQAFLRFGTVESQRFDIVVTVPIDAVIDIV